MQVAGSAEIDDALAAEEREVALHAGGYGALGEVAVLLSFLLTVEDGRAQGP